MTYWLLAMLAAAPAFDVASVKPAELAPGPYSSNLGTAGHGKVALTNVTLSDCLRFAYGISNDLQIAGPDWIRSKDVRFHIVAKAPPDTPRSELLLMLQALLAERFQLTLHREHRNLTVLALVVGKSGARLQPARDNSDGTGNNFTPGRIISNRTTMGVLVMLLSRFMRQAVVDRTGLAGMFEVKLEWTPQTQPGEEASGASIFTAVQEQLGLKLEAQKGPLEVIVIDHAERVPTDN